LVQQCLQKMPICRMASHLPLSGHLRRRRTRQHRRTAPRRPLLPLTQPRPPPHQKLRRANHSSQFHHGIVLAARKYDQLNRSRTNCHARLQWVSPTPGGAKPHQSPIGHGRSLGVSASLPCQQQARLLFHVALILACLVLRGPIAPRVHPHPHRRSLRAHSRPLEFTLTLTGGSILMPLHKCAILLQAASSWCNHSRLLERLVPLRHALLTPNRMPGGHHRPGLPRTSPDAHSHLGAQALWAAQKWRRSNASDHEAAVRTQICQLFPRLGVHIRGLALTLQGRPYDIGHALPRTLRKVLRPLSRKTYALW